MNTELLGGVLIGVALLTLCLGIVRLLERPTDAIKADEALRVDGGESSERGSDGGERTCGSRTSEDKLSESAGSDQSKEPRGASEPRFDGGVATGYGFVTSKPTGPRRWLTTVDHKDIGMLYLTFGITMFLWGGTDAIMARTELLTPNATVFGIQTYNELFTTHAITMLFLFATPIFFGLANYFLPLLIGADDMAFPRVNAIGFWVLPPAAVLIRFGIISDAMATILAPVAPAMSALFMGFEPIDTAWTFYPPLSTGTTNPQIDMALLGLHLSGIGTTLAAINIIGTVFTGRAPDVGWERLDILSWTLLTQAGLILFAFPLLGSILIMLLLDRNIGTAFFAIEHGGPILYQHLFWFFGHPEVYILILPPFGLISLILPKFVGRKLFGFKYIIYSTLAIGVLSFGVWAHHMFTTGMDPRIGGAFMAVTLAIAVPSAVKVFNWLTTMWDGTIRLEAPMLFCVGAISTFILGGVTGIFLGSIPVNQVFHGTYYVVGHFHFFVSGITIFAVFAGIYYWFPLMARRMYNKQLATVHFGLSFVGVNFLSFGMLILGLLGQPRRSATYSAEFMPIQWMAGTGAVLLAIGQAIWLYNMIQSYRAGPIVTDADPWGLKEYGQHTKEWEWFESQLEEVRGEPTASDATIKADGETEH